MQIFDKKIVYSLPLFLVSIINADESYTTNTTSLKDAIKRISEISQKPFLLDKNILQNKQANPIQNIKSLPQALKKVLLNTGLEAIINENTIVIKKIKSYNIEKKEKTLSNVLIIGHQNSYYDEYSSTNMKGEFRDIEMPYSSNTTNSTFIEDIQALKLADTYAYTTGLVKSDPRADGIIMRGIEVNLQNIQVNGMPGLLSRFGSPTTANVEKIEVSKFPASVLYGNMDSGGFINIITKKPQAQNKITIETSYNTYLSSTSNFRKSNSFTTSFDATGRIKDNLYYRFITVKESLQSYRGENVKYNNHYIYPSLLWNINDQSSLLFSIEYGKEYANADEGLAVLNNNLSSIKKQTTYYQEKGDYDNDKGTISDIKFEHDFVDESKLNISWRSVWHEDERNLYENSSVDNSNQTLIRRYRNQKNKRVWHTFDTNYITKINIIDFIHTITFGSTLSYRMQDFDRLRYATSDLKGIDLFNPTYGESSSASADTKRKTIYKSKSVYIQDKVDVTNDLIFVASFRADKTNISFDCVRGESNSCIDNKTSSYNTVGSLGLIYSINYYTSLFTNITQGYDPITAERVDKNNNGLQSEQSEQIEFGIKFNVNEQFHTILSLYEISKDNVAQKIEDNIYEQTSKTNSKGVELDFQWLPTKNWQVKAGYAYNDTTNISKQQKYKNANSPQNTAFIFTRYNFPKKLFQGLVGISTGISYKDSIYTSSDKNNAVKLPSYSKIDFGVYYEKNDWSISLNIKNVMDKSYYEYGDDDYSIYPGESRNITINYKITF